MKTLPGPPRADLGRPQPRRPDPRRCRSRTCSAASRSRSTSTSIAVVPRRRRPCSSPAPAARSARELCRQIARLGAARLVARRPLRVGAVRDRARARRRARLRRRRCRCSPTAATGRRCARSSSATGRRSSSTPRPTSTCRCIEANPLQAVTQQRARDARDRRRRRRVRRRALRAGLDRQGREPEERLIGQSKALCEWIVEALRRAATTSRRASSRCASATCSARRAA